MVTHLVGQFRSRSRSLAFGTRCNVVKDQVSACDAIYLSRFFVQGCGKERKLTGIAVSMCGRKETADHFIQRTDE
jgi:hypothetical protein